MSEERRKKILAKTSQIKQKLAKADRESRLQPLSAVCQFSVLDNKSETFAEIMEILEDLPCCGSMLDHRSLQAGQEGRWQDARIDLLADDLQQLANQHKLLVKNQVIATWDHGDSPLIMLPFQQLIQHLDDFMEITYPDPLVFSLEEAWVLQIYHENSWYFGRWQ